MGTGTLPTVLRGPIIPDPRFTWDNFSTSSSSYTEYGPRPGDVEPLDDSDLVLEAVGTIGQTTDVTGRTIEAGSPDGTARFVWKQSGDALWRGWAPPVNLTGFRFVARSTTANKWHPHHLAKLADGSVLIVSHKDLRQIVVHKLNASSGAATEVEVYDPGATMSIDAYPCLLVLPSGRVLCYYWRDFTTYYLVGMSYSDDGGATWAVGSQNVLSGLVAGLTPLRIRAAELRDQVCMILHLTDTGTGDEELHQYASNDLGASFSLIDTLDSGDRGYPDIIEHQGRLVMGYVSTAPGGYSATYIPYIRVLGNAFSLLSDATAIPVSATTDTMEWATVAAGLFTAGEFALWKGDEGNLYVAGADMDSGGGAYREVMVRWSTDGGETWDHLGGIGPVVADGVPTWTAADLSTYPKDFAIIEHQGRSLLASRHAANPGTGDDSVSLMYLGGYTSVEPAQDVIDFPDPELINGYVITWVPYDLPDNTGATWTYITAGAPTVALTELGLHVTTAGGESAVWRAGPTLAGTLAEGLEVIAEVRVEAGTARVNLRISDATPLEYEVVAQVSTTAITFYDNKAAANIATVASTIASGAHIQVKVAISTATAKMWYRHVGTNHAQADQEWILLGSTTTATSAAVNNGHAVIFGQDANSETYWRLVGVSHDFYTGGHIVNQSNPDDLVGRPYSARPVYLTDGVSIQAIDGPGFRNEEWNLTPRFDYPVSNVHTPSPREVWRSQDDDTQVDLVWDFGGTTWPMGALLGVYLGECNFGTATLWGRPAGGVWANLGTMDLRVQTGLKYTLDDRIVRPDTTGGSSCAMFFPIDILAGSHIVVGGAGESSVVRKIRHNTGGAWVAGSTTQNTRILLEEVDGTEDASGTAAEIWLKDGVFIVPVTTAYDAFRIRIPVQSTAEGYFQIGVVNIGHFHHFARAYDWGRSLEVTPIYEMTEGRTGLRRVRRLAKARRAVEIGWTDGVDASAGTAINPAPNFALGWTAGGAASGVGADAMTLYDVYGLLERCGGAEVPVTYVAAAPPPSTSSSLVRVVNRALVLHGRVVTETWRKDVVLGNEWADPGELHRGSTLRIEEDV